MRRTLALWLRISGASPPRLLAWAAPCALALLVGCTRDNPRYAAVPDGAADPDAAHPEAGPTDGRTPGGDTAPADAGPDTRPADAAPAGDLGPAPDARIAGPVDDDGDGVPDDTDCDDSDPAVYPGAPERCNGVDDDCDGPADEGFTGLGEACAAGTGACRAEGVGICAGLGGVRCGAAPEIPADEMCNDIDDDCDGAVDEQVVGCCDPDAERPCGTDEGICQAGIQRCAADGTFGPCLGGVIPEPERCGGEDDDCDGAVDEGFAIGLDCLVGVGACRREGVTACAADAIECDAIPGDPIDELCNAIDDDCDGAVDEPFPELGGPCAAGVGACARDGRLVCGPDGVTCDAAPGPAGVEICNGIDEDCDGTTDESVGGGMPCEVGRGACRRDGMLICNAAGGLACDVAPGPRSAERCDGIDDDCDGTVDEAFPQLGDDCVVATGGCMSAGVVVCAPGGGDVACEAPPAQGIDERCNAIDDDCDGTVDEGFGVGDPCLAGIGACATPGRQICDAGEATCDARSGPPGEETCNGIDDDCDGIPDEGFGVGEACAAGVGACRAEGRVICADDGPGCDAVALPPADEGCDGIDDDCDGAIDEGVANACGGCGAVPDERCNAIDDDCDGQVDEGLGICVVEVVGADAPDVMGFGRVLAAAGDIDGDGFGEVLVGAPDGEQGAVVLLDGRDSRPLWTVRDVVTFGGAVAAGDVDGDGIRELFVGAPGIGNGAVVQLDLGGAEVQRIPGTDDFRAGRSLLAADGAPWIVMGDRDARPTFFGPAGALRLVRFDGGEQITLEGENGEALGDLIHLAPDTGADGLPDIRATSEGFVDRAVRLFVDPPAGDRSEPLSPGFTNGSFGEAIVSGRLLADEPPITVYGAPLAGNRQSGVVYLYDSEGLAIGGQLGNAGGGDRQGHRLVVLPRPEADRDALILAGASMSELRVWELLRGVGGRVVIATSAPIRGARAGDGMGRSLLLTDAAPDGTRRLFVGEPDAAGGGRVHVFSVR